MTLAPTDHAVDSTETGRNQLGRLPSIDFRDRKHLAKPKALTPTTDLSYRYYMTPPALDQGTTPQCVAYGWEQFLSAAPVKNKPWKSPADLYNEAQKVDEWEGEGYEGTSVRAGAKVLQAAGYLSEYQWAFDIDTVVAWLLRTGPVVLGINWYDGMFYPNRFGYIQPLGPLAGGHCILAKGANRQKYNPDGSLGAVRLINSWGTNWGEKGMVWISFADLNRLILEWGEACMAKELKVKTEAKG